MSYGNPMQRAARKYIAAERESGLSLVGTPPADFLEFCKLCRIKTKEEGIINFDPELWFAEQRRFERERTGRDIVLKSRQIGFCGEPGTRVLTADLRWVTLDEILVGEEIVAVDENVPGGRGAGRKMRTGVVQAKEEVFESALRLRMDNGVSMTFTGQHRLLCKQRGGPMLKWRRTSDMRVGDQIRYVTKPWGEPTVEDGWFGGMLDGEGSFHRGPPGVCVSQLRGPVWDRMVRYCQDREYSFRIEGDRRSPNRSSKFGKRPVFKVVIGRMNELFRLIGQTRPTRFVGRRWWEGRDLPGKRSGETCATIVAIEPLPAQRMIDLQTSAKTFIAEGFVSHNSTHELMRGLHQSSTRESRNTAIVGHDHDLVEDLFENVRFAAEGLAKIGRLPPTAQDNVRQIRFAGLGSQISVTEAGASVEAASKKGHSGTIHRLHATEVSRWNNPVETLTGLLGAVPDSGEILFESTANGAGGWFFDTVMQCRETPGRPYTLHFYPWLDHERYRAPVRLGFQPAADDEYEENLRDIGCDDEQMQWWRDKVEDLTLDVALEQYPYDIDVAFRASGRTYFEAKTLDKLAHHVTEPIERRPIMWEGRLLGELLIYALPYGRKNYVVGGDVSEGVGADAHAACVMDSETGETCATFCCDNIEAGDFGLALAVMGKLYNGALVAPERNNNGHAAIRALTAEAKYHSIYHAFDGRAGWLTGGRTRPIMFDDLHRACRKGEVWTPDAGTMSETKTLIVDKDGKPRARDKGSSAGCKDDRFIAWSIAWQVRGVAASTNPKAGKEQREPLNEGGF